MLKKKVGLAEIALVLSIAVLVVIVAVSVLLIFVTVFFKDGRLNITGVTEILSSSNTYFALKNSIVIALGTTALSTVIGVVLHGSLRALLVCLYSPAHFGVPVILGTEKGIYNIPTKIHERIYASSGSFEAISTGTILSAILVISAAIILKIQNSLLKEGRFQIIAGKSMRPVVLKLRGLKIPMLIVSILYILITVVLPTVRIFLIGGLKKYGLPFFLKNMTWNNYFEIFRWKMTKDAIWNSVFVSVGAAFVTMLASVMISYVTVKMKVCGKFALEFLGVLPFSIPCTVIALGCILTWSGRFEINLYNTAGIIFVTYIARYMALPSNRILRRWNKFPIRLKKRPIRAGQRTGRRSKILSCRLSVPV